MGDSRDYFDDMGTQLISYGEDDRVCKERDELKAILSGYKTHDQMKDEIEALKAEVEDLKMTEKVYYMNKDWIADAKVEIQSLKAIAESYRWLLQKTVDAISSVETKIKDIRLQMINLHNNETDANTLRCKFLVLGSELGLLFEAVNWWNITNGAS